MDIQVVIQGTTRNAFEKFQTRGKKRIKITYLIMTPGFLYKECMYRVSQIQAIRNELIRDNIVLDTILQDKALPCMP